MINLQTTVAKSIFHNVKLSIYYPKYPSTK